MQSSFKTISILCCEEDPPSILHEFDNICHIACKLRFILHYALASRLHIAFPKAAAPALWLLPMTVATFPRLVPVGAVILRNAASALEQPIGGWWSTVFLNRGIAHGWPFPSFSHSPASVASFRRDLTCCEYSVPSNTRLLVGHDTKPTVSYLPSKSLESCSTEGHVVIAGKAEYNFNELVI